MNYGNLSIGSTEPSPKSALALMLLLALFAMLSIATTGCKTKKMSQELQYERSLKIDSIMEQSSDIRDLSVADILITEFSNDSLIPQRIVKTTSIRLQNDIKTSRLDKSSVQTKDSLKTQEIVKNKSSPDKTSQTIFSLTSIIVVLIILLALILLIRILIKK